MISTELHYPPNQLVLQAIDAACNSARTALLKDAGLEAQNAINHQLAYTQKLLAGPQNYPVLKYRLLLSGRLKEDAANARIAVLANEFNGNPFYNNGNAVIPADTDTPLSMAYILWRFDTLAAADLFSVENGAALEARSKELGLIA